MNNKYKKNEWDDFFKQRENRLFGPEEFIVKNKGYLKKGSVLDIACGDGRNAIFLAKEGFKVKGIDFSCEALRRLEFFAKEIGVIIDVEEVDLNNMKLIETIGRFDNIIVNHYKPTEEMLEAIPQLLKEQGIFLLCTFNYLQSIEKGYHRRFCLEENELVDRFSDMMLIKHETFQDQRGYFDGYIFKMNK